MTDSQGQDIELTLENHSSVLASDPISAQAAYFETNSPGRYRATISATKSCEELPTTNGEFSLGIPGATVTVYSSLSTHGIIEDRTFAVRARLFEQSGISSRTDDALTVAPDPMRSATSTLQSWNTGIRKAIQSKRYPCTTTDNTGTSLLETEYMAPNSAVESGTLPTQLQWMR